VKLNSFSLLVGVGATLGLAWVVWQAPEKQALRRVDQGLWLLLGSLLGGRAAHVATAWPYYAGRLLETPQVWLGGFSGAGALAGGLMALVLLASITRQPLGDLADAYMPLAAVLAVCAWLGCWLDGCAYGAETTAWWALPARDEWGELRQRFPVQLLAASLTLGLFWLVDRSRTHLPHPGQPACLALLGLGLLTFGISFIRVDPSQTWWGWRPETWTGVGFSFLAIIAYLLTFSPLRSSVSGASSTGSNHPKHTP
jgi:phosphatidylglycerol---prolipoprotein diacylglyceryl transferase